MAPDLSRRKGGIPGCRGCLTTVNLRRLRHNFFRKNMLTVNWPWCGRKCLGAGFAIPTAVAEGLKGGWESGEKGLRFCGLKSLEPEARFKESLYACMRNQAYQLSISLK